MARKNLHDDVQSSFQKFKETMLLMKLADEDALASIDEVQLALGSVLSKLNLIASKLMEANNHSVAAALKVSALSVQKEKDFIHKLQEIIGG
jgi:hypothetical protein